MLYILLAAIPKDRRPRTLGLADGGSLRVTPGSGGRFITEIGAGTLSCPGSPSVSGGRKMKSGTMLFSPLEPLCEPSQVCAT